MRIRIPIVRAASTNPAAAIVLPDAVGCRKRKRRSAPGSSSGFTSGSRSSSSSAVSTLDRLVELLLEVLVVAVQAVAVLLVALVAGDQLGEHPRERVDLVAAQLGARSKAGRMVGDDALEAEHERVANLPLGGRRLEPRFHLCEGVVERLAACMAFAEHLGGVLVLPQEGLAGP